ncbi:MAG: Na/Pi cotransporter family protein [Treponema sp.]|jgi:phosphate:Na+ symporter|nr:Na/Pi cotransporter family protein [Treponema sp.]
MTVISTLLKITGGLCLFLYGMKVMSDGIQRAAGDRLQRFLNLITGNRFTAVFTGFAITAIIQSSSATTVMVVSLVNAGLLNLTQSIGLIMGANIGTTVTAWVVSLIGFSLKLSELALPAVGVGFICSMVKWKYRDIGEFILGFGLLFMGLDFLTKSMPSLGENVYIISKISNMGFFTYVIGTVFGMMITLFLHSSSATTAIILTMAYNGIIGYEIAASMILGANIGTTIDAALASIGTKTNAKRAALVHVLFNIFGTCWALPLLKPLLALVELVTPGTMTPGMVNDPMVTAHLAMLHTVFNMTNTIVFLPFVKYFASFVTFLIKDDPSETAEPVRYRFTFASGKIQNTPEMQIVFAEKEVRDMANHVLLMFSRFNNVIQALFEMQDRQTVVTSLGDELKQKEEYADQMRDQIGAFLMICAKEQLNPRSEHRVSQLLRIISDLEEISDDCCSLSFILENGVKENLVIKKKEMDALIPYLNQVENFLNLVKDNLGRKLSPTTLSYARELEKEIDFNRDKLRKLGRKRLESGKDVKTELLFIDIVRRIEKLGDYCLEIAETLAV